MSGGDTNNDRDVARAVFARHQEIETRGHRDFCERARTCEDYYLGGGLQWRPEDRYQLEEEEGRPCYEINDIMPAVNSAGGYQIANRMDIAFLPRGHGTDEELAKVFSKYAKHCLDNTAYRDHETEVFLDGLIQQRGFFDARMDYQNNTKGDIRVEDLDPMDVKPDPDSKTYDPDGWADVLIDRFFSEREIEGRYGKDAAQYAKDHARAFGRYGNTDINRDESIRSRFGSTPGPSQSDWGSYGAGLSYMAINDNLTMYRVIERQSFEYQNCMVAEYPTGDLKVIDGLPVEQIAGLIKQGVYISRRRMQRVRWETVLPDAVIFNGFGPYEHYTVVPFFPYFRRGRTRGLVDNAISPQNMTNKFVSQYGAIVNTITNSGLDIEDGQLISPTAEHLETRGSMNGLIIVRKKGTPPIAKIEPNQAPTGIEKMVMFGADGIKRATGINESLTGSGSEDMSGVAIQSRQFAAQQQLAIPLWRLSQTRRLLAVRIRKMIQRFMFDERTVRITETDEFGIERHSMLTVNQVQDDGSVLHDLTVGTYDMAITEQPMQVTFDNSQFEQIKSMRKDMGVAIPDSVVLRYSTLPDKEEIAAAIKANAAEQVDPVAEAQAAKLQAETGKTTAQTDLTKAQTAEQNATALFSAARVAQLVRADPDIAKIADMLAKSCGFIDHDGNPIVPTPGEATQPYVMNPVAPTMKLPPPTNTDPLTPGHPDVGAEAGLHTLDAPH